ncbi:MAG: NADH-quinone oxidoreductase subunit M [Propionibacteriaceae bacterium]|jgi:NADH-quinone oxidoreductase subunit M|nr:NADH-quinone oxidoreductase subunit M [Propionibacteriaceae bacterium]
MMTWLTTILALLPLAGALVTALAKEAARTVGLLVSFATLALGVVVGILFWQGTALDLSYDWLPQLGAGFTMTLDGMGAAMALLTVFLVPFVLLSEWATERGGSYAALTLLVESFSLFVFLTGDVLVFYIFFEATLIPMYFLIGGWGSDQVAARAAALKFLLFGLAGGLIMLFGVVGVAALSAGAAGAGGSPTLNIAELAGLDLGGSTLAKVTFVAFFVAFALKAPMVPGHTWLPAAAAQSTPGGAALMVGVLDKLGTFGMVRFCLQLFPGETDWATPVVVVLALISIFYGALAALGQKNLMRLVAFTSISHFGFMVLGIFALTTPAVTGSIFYMVNHGLSTGALFLLVGYLIRRRGSAEIASFGGVVKLAPVLAGFTLLAGLAGAALPGTSSFVSEFLVMAGTWPRFHVVAAIAAAGTIFAALYILWMYQRVFTGPVPDDVGEAITGDLTLRERVAVIPLLIAILGLGFFPQPALHIIEPASEAIVATADAVDPAPVIIVEGVN